MSETQNDAKFEEWAKLELFGRQVLAGRVSEQTIAGVGWIRIDVPAAGDMPAFTRFFQPAACFGITPTTEEIATKLAQAYRTEPINRYELPAPKTDTVPNHDHPMFAGDPIEDDDPDDDTIDYQDEE